MKSSWSGCGDCGSFGSCPPPGSASATRAPSPGRARVPRPTGPFPAGGSEPSRPPLQGTGTPRPGPGALDCLRRGAGMDWGSPLRPRFGRKWHTRCSPVEGGRSECIDAVRLANPEDVLVGCADGFERVDVLVVDVVRGPQNMHDGHVARPGNTRSRSTGDALTR